MEFKFEEKETYSLEEVKELIEGFKSQVNETITEKETTIQDLQSKIGDLDKVTGENLELLIKNSMLVNGLSEDMIDLVKADNIEDANAKIEKLKALTKEREIDKSYKPTEKRKDDDYGKYEKEGNVEGMLKNKLSRLFG